MVKIIKQVGWHCGTDGAENPVLENRVVKMSGDVGDVKPPVLPVWSLRDLLVWAYRDQLVHLSDRGNDVLGPLGYASMDFEAVAELGVRVDVFRAGGFCVHRDAEKVHEIVSLLDEEDRAVIIGRALLDDFPSEDDLFMEGKIVPVLRPNGKLKMAYRNGRAVACLLEIVQPDVQVVEENRQVMKILHMLGYFFESASLSVCVLDLKE